MRGQFSLRFTHGTLFLIPLLNMPFEPDFDVFPQFIEMGIHPPNQMLPLQHSLAQVRENERLLAQSREE